MAWTEEDIPDLTGRVAVVTGANGGLGLETARALAGKGAHVVMAARNQDKAAAARDDILGDHPAAVLEIVAVDLGDQASVKQAAKDIVAAHPRIDILVNNAGLMAMPEQRTADDYEMQFGVNHLGHWTFTAGLMPALLAADAARVVTVSSTAHHIGRAVDADNPHLEGTYGPWKGYGQAKLANYHFGLGLQQQFEQAGARAQSLIAHPGLTNSDLQGHTVEEGGGGRLLAPFFHMLARVTGMDTRDGARSQLRAATDPDAEGGEFYGPMFMNNGPPVKKPLLRPGRQQAIETLWEISERETGVAMEVTANG